MAALIYSIIGALMCALIGKDRKIGFWWSFIMRAIISPLLGLPIILLMKPKVAMQDLEPKEQKKRKIKYGVILGWFGFMLFCLVVFLISN